MLGKLSTYSLLGIEAHAVEVEVDISPAAMPRTTLVGLAEAAAKESVHRIERALVNSGYTRPVDRIVINLSPARFLLENTKSEHQRRETPRLVPASFSAGSPFPQCLRSGRLLVR